MDELLDWEDLDLIDECCKDIELEEFTDSIIYELDFEEV